MSTNIEQLPEQQRGRLETAMGGLLTALQDRAESAIGPTPTARPARLSRQVRERGAACLAAALQYAARGFHILPLHSITSTRACTCGKRSCGSAGKHPLTANGLKDATIDAAVIRAWWARWPYANVGIRTGEASGLAVLDIDPQHGGDVSFADLKAKGPLPPTSTVQTGGGGRHLYFRAVPGLRNGTSNVAQGVDVRAEDGYVVAPPSRHVSGYPYLWMDGCDPATVAPAVAPDWLRERATGICRDGNTVPDGSIAGSQLAPNDWARLVDEGVAEGSRNTKAAGLTGYLLRAGVHPFVAFAIIKLWNESRCHPSLPDDEVDGIVGSICRAELRKQRGAP